MSEKSLLDKLIVKSGQSLLVINAPAGYIESKLGKIPDTIKIQTGAAKGEFDVIQVFVESKKELEARLPKLKKQASRDGKIWVTYPKGSSTDVNRDIIRDYAATVGLEAVAIISVDEKRSALRLKRSE